MSRKHIDKGVKNVSRNYPNALIVRYLCSLWGQWQLWLQPLAAVTVTVVSLWLLGKTRYGAGLLASGRPKADMISVLVR